MKKRFNVPTVFLSHSKKNSAFIEKLDKDLQKCQIKTWLDTNKIRHGESWQDSIFEYGLPTCDAVLVYFTEDSLASPVVKKEIDAALLHKLNDNNVAFLPYVNDERIRTKLRSDIQALQTPEWNHNNYSSLLPQVVAEIWRSYLERTVTSATNSERIKRIELEQKLKKRESSSFFTESEEAEFEFIWNSGNKEIEISIRVQDIDDDSEYLFRLNLATLIANIPNFTEDVFRSYTAHAVIQAALSLPDITLPENKYNEKHINFNFYLVDNLPRLSTQLLTYGLLENKPYQSQIVSPSPLSRDGLNYETVISQKYFRYKYWLSYKKMHSGKITITTV